MKKQKTVNWTVNIRLVSTQPVVRAKSFAERDPKGARALSILRKYFL